MAAVKRVVCYFLGFVLSASFSCGRLRQLRDRKVHLENVWTVVSLILIHRICWQWFLSYPLACSSSNRWVAFGSLPYSAQHDLNQSCLLSVCESCTQQGKKKQTLSLCSFASLQKCRDVKKRDAPSSPGSGSSSSRLIIHSQSFSSSAPHSHRESTR